MPAPSKSSTANTMRGGGASSVVAAPTASLASRNAAQLAEVPALFECGTVFSSSAKPVRHGSVCDDVASSNNKSQLPLTEAETEYVVSAVKHVCANGYLVVQFNCSNTLSDKLLTNVRVKLAPTDDADTRLKPVRFLGFRF